MFCIIGQDVFSNYPVSIIRTLNMGLEELLLFLRELIRAEKRLTIFDLFHASTWSERFDLRERIAKFNFQPQYSAIWRDKTKCFFTL